MAGLGLVLPFAVQVDVAFVEVDAIAGDADHALDQEHIRIARLEEDDDVAAMDGAIAHEGCPVRGRRQVHAIDEDVIANEQSVLHGAGRDDEVLKNEGQDEEADNDDGSSRTPRPQAEFRRASRCSRAVLLPEHLSVHGGVGCRFGHQSLLRFCCDRLRSADEVQDAVPAREVDHTIHNAVAEFTTRQGWKYRWPRPMPENRSTHQVESSPPACLVEEMNDHTLELLHAYPPCWDAHRRFPAS